MGWGVVFKEGTEEQIEYLSRPFDTKEFISYFIEHNEYSIVEHYIKFNCLT